MDTLCRICIEHVAKCTSLSTKIEDSSNRSFFDFLNKCTTLNAREGDSLPQSLCSVCANAMKTFHSFMKLAEKSDLILREALRNLIAEGRYNGRRETPRGEIAVTKKIEKKSKDFSQGNSFHRQPGINSTGRKLYTLDIVKKEPLTSESTSIVNVKGAEITETEKLESNLDHPKGDIEELDGILFCIGRHLTSIDAKHNDSEDDVPISLLKSRLVSNEDGADSQSNTLSAASNVQSKLGKTEAKSKEVKEDPKRVRGSGGLTENSGIACEETRIGSEKVEEDSFRCQPRKNSTEPSPYILDFVKEEPRVSESASIGAGEDAEIDESESNPECSIEEPDSVLSRKDRRRPAINYTEFSDSEDDVPISFLGKRWAEDEETKDATYSESASSEESTTKNETTEIRHKCNQCRKEFTNIYSLKRHKRWHDNPNPFKCEDCGKLLCTKQGYSRHMEYCKSQMRKCDHCDKEFRSIYYLRRHMRSHKNAKSFKCGSCGASFRRKDRCIKHNVICKRRSKPQGLKRSELNKSETNCRICGRTFSRKDYLEIHMNNHMGIVSKCNICGKTFEHGSNLKRHMKLHDDPKRFNCEVCGKSLSSYYSKHREYCRRPGEPLNITKVECEICGKKYTTKTTLDMHMEIHKGVTRKCDQCGKEFKNKISFVRHIKWHKNPRPFKCEYCGKALARKPSYEKHKKICKLADKQPQLKPQSPVNSEPEKRVFLPGMKVACEICGKQYRKKSHLNAHMESHKGIRYKCDQCGKDFKTSKSLRTHMGWHKNPQSFKCEKCEELFACKASYTKHSYICQAKAKPQCEVCGKQFTSKYYLGLHKEIHEAKKEKCEECGKEFSRLSLSRHMRTHTYAKPCKCENCGKSFASKYEFMDSRHLENCKPIGNTIDDTETTEEPILHSKGNKDIIEEVTK